MQLCSVETRAKWPRAWGYWARPHLPLHVRLWIAAEVGRNYGVMSSGGIMFAHLDHVFQNRRNVNQNFSPLNLILRLSSILDGVTTFSSALSAGAKYLKNGAVANNIPRT